MAARKSGSQEENNDCVDVVGDIIRYTENQMLGLIRIHFKKGYTEKVCEQDGKCDGQKRLLLG